MITFRGLPMLLMLRVRLQGCLTFPNATLLNVQN